MNTDQLSPASKAALDQLLEGILGALNSEEDCPHVSAISESNLDRNSPLVFNGGGLVGPDKPQFDYDEKALRNLHRAFLKSDKALYRIIVHCQRPDDESDWTLVPKLISQDEQQSLETAIKPLSTQIEAELRAVRYKGKLDYLTFGRSNGQVRLGLSLEGKPYERKPPSDKLVQILTLVDKVYEKAGLRLVSGDWTLRPASFDYSEYYE
jgi:hypothetical protein